MIRDYVMLLCLCTVSGKEGYFWHISDIHFDPSYSIQGNGDGKCWSPKSRAGLNDKMPNAGPYGHYNCDSPWALVESAAKAMKTIHGDIEFVLWTGDTLSKYSGSTDESRMRYLKNISDLLSHTFTGQFVFPVLGHEDAGLNFSRIANLWRNWLPDEALVTLRENGYYTIEQRSKNYQIISLNTNLWLSPVSDNRMPVSQQQQQQQQLQQRIVNQPLASAMSSSSDPANQWRWFDSVLNTARKKGKTVFIVGHTPPGIDDRESGTGGITEEHNARYLQTVRQYADMIRGQFFGHWHSDSFRVMYSDDDEPVSWAMMAPSITPYRSGGPNNPGLRLYKFDIDTGQILDYSQYYLNLPEANSGKRANWRHEYNLREYYELQEITALSLHDLADRFTQTNDNAFVRYYAANRVSLPREVEEIWGCGGALNGLCALQHYCTVTRLTSRGYASCVSSYAYALASAISTSWLLLTVHLLLMLSR
ncbi:acid sphingomyelinase-like phosphodiesterase 3a [Phymastichus coffea]|uniref:acid sphingomyelinase-like phosphodiesterase 3a n=1 Tax=Phymastichus coffea TaxID=108790 RepID=UPI00273BCB77|nr:acid sphingomyelinase-like phosphodiesterase 3a [Phymastichus coffea]XP_058791127.1 acid sphingomyelinase-like phosphodiesterase 3a [Phymastichus coffea]